ncbi:RNase H1/viroplasmin domain-containing protein [Paraglaciecola aquimarina]|uniref:RNase H1/viroplasmin domain-containing protein n=1 Tax=Paraglaciecola algarum TaxID=3050085 RepID=A0ABS9D8J4_9ALTE|nr:RNase H1/viroplasmin domain-containing protein [Paraglaciecola sp. G1-23]MCF2949258.1 RNase H1/viroplasmin domain-containing protein [Paraglaciecola sp. G1-23]
MSIQSITDAPAYIVYIGRQPGVYKNWDDVHKQINDCPLAWYRPFQSVKEARSAFSLWKRQQKMPIEKLLSQNTQPAKKLTFTNQKAKHRLKNCLKWCATLNRTHSIEAVRAIVKIANQMSTPLTVQSLSVAYSHYINQPPWD